MLLCMSPYSPSHYSMDENPPMEDELHLNKSPLKVHYQLVSPSMDKLPFSSPPFMMLFANGSYLWEQRFSADRTIGKLFSIEKTGNFQKYPPMKCGNLYLK